MTIKNRIRNLERQTLYQGWSTLTQARYDYQRSDGSWQAQQRDLYDCGHGAAILLYDLDRRTVILTRQFRAAPYCAGYDDLLMEVPAGLLDGASPEDRIRAETEEETGFRITGVQKVFEAFMSPGALIQKNTCFVAPYSPDQRVSEGGGHVDEGEDIEVLEVSFDDAMEMIGDGRIQDGKTIMLLQYAALNLFR